jgi:hypothetical protein
MRDKEHTNHVQEGHNLVGDYLQHRSEDERRDTDPNPASEGPSPGAVEVGILLMTVLRWDTW